VEAPSALDLLFVDLPFDSYELGQRFKSAWSHKRFLCPHELHLGFRYMVSTLRAAGHTADILFPQEEGPVRTAADLVRAVAETRPLVLGLTSYEGSLRESLRFVKRLRARGVSSLVCLGGHLATFSYAEILRDFHDLVDVIVLGDGERAIVEILEAVKHGQGFDGIPGLARFDGGRVVTTATRPIEQDIDRLPFPVLAEPALHNARRRPLFLTTSRGCYGRCSFCRSSHFGEGWRARGPMNVVDEIEAACARGVTTFEMVDDNFLGPGRMGKRRAVAMATEIQRRGIAIRFHASCRVNDVEEATMRLLKDAGLVSVSLGVESGVQRLLDAFNKGTTVQQNVAALHLLDRLEIPALAYIIFFDPYTTLVEAKENVAFLRSIRQLDHVRFEDVVFRRLIPISGTDLFERIRADGLLRGDYLSGHRFVFVESRVGLLADFMELFDIRFERLLRDARFGRIEGLRGFKEKLQLDVADKAIDLLASSRCKRSEAFRRLNELLVAEMRGLFGTSPRGAEDAVPAR
jgi:anaerobic magnesium-protoporphyrin IX monomethyl ester cyclase